MSVSVCLSAPSECPLCSVHNIVQNVLSFQDELRLCVLLSRENKQQCVIFSIFSSMKYCVTSAAPPDAVPITSYDY